MTRVILVGLGPRGRYWLTVLSRRADCEVVALCDPDPAARTRAQEALPDTPAFATLEDALARTQPDALVLATPPDTRAPHVRLACQHRLALLVEKPLALTLGEAERFVAQAEEADIPLMVGLNFRYLGVTRATLELLRAGTVGQPAFGRFTYERYRDGRLPHLNKYPLRMDHPMLWEQSIHHFDLLRFVYGLEPTRVYCRTWNPSWSMYAGDTNVSALFTLEGGVEVTYQGTWQSAWRQPHFCWRTDCDGGVILQGDQFGELGYARRDDDTLTPVALPPHETWITDTAGVLDAFLRHLGGGPLECSGRDHLASLRMVAACILSSERGDAVSLDEVSLEAPMV